MVRLVFRPYTQVWRTICTSVPLRASIRVSPDFTLLKNRSSSFGFLLLSSYARPSQKIRSGRCWWITPAHLELTFITPMGFTPADSLGSKTPWSVFQDGSIKLVLAKSILTHKHHLPKLFWPSSVILPFLRASITISLTTCVLTTACFGKVTFFLKISQVLSLPSNRFHVF